MERMGGSGPGRSVARGGCSVFADTGQKAGAELLEFAQAHPLDLQERLLGRGALSRQLT